MLQPVESSRRRGRQGCQHACKPSRLDRGGAAEVTRRFRELMNQFANGRLNLRRRWFTIDLLRGKRILQKEACIIDQSELCILLFGNEALQGEYPANLWQLAK